MYFFIAGITTKILLWVFVAAFGHLGFISVVSALGGSKFELPFYLKPIYPAFVKLINEMDSYNDFKEGDTVTYGFFALGLLAFAFSALFLNMIIFPLISGSIFTYLVISFRMQYGKVDGEEKDTDEATTPES